MTKHLKPELETICFLAKLTEQGQLCWREDESDTYSSSAAGERFVVEFLRFEPTSGCGADRTLARLSAFLTVWDFAVGTECYDRICEMLAASEPRLKEWRADCETRWLERFNAFKTKVRKDCTSSQRNRKRKAS